jgi:hypothetical protein
LDRFKMPGETLMPDKQHLFPDCYDDSLARFRLSLEAVQSCWPAARLFTRPLAGQPDLTLDWIEAHAVEKPERVLLLTCGQHGIEGFTGSAIQQLFVHEFLKKLEPAKTGLVLVHAINPWGMLHRRKTNRKNVDLNRNFVTDLSAFVMEKNQDFEKLAVLFLNKKPVPPVAIAKIEFLFQLITGIIKTGPTRLQAAALLGQHRFPDGIYYGGTELQEETLWMMELFNRMIKQYDQFLTIDIHTGYGPRYQMGMVTSSLEKRSSARCQEEYRYPRVVKMDASEFYRIEGDMIEYLFVRAQEQIPEKRFFATTFEFGTFGDSTLAGLRSLRAMVLESRLAACGAADGRTGDWIRQEFRELYIPVERRWREKALLDARQALSGILAAEGFLQKTRQRDSSHLED